MDEAQGYDVVEALERIAKAGERSASAQERIAYALEQVIDKFGYLHVKTSEISGPARRHNHE